MKRNTVEFGTSVYITSLFCSGKKMGKLSERNRIVEIRKAQAGEPVAFMGVEDGRLEMLFLSPEERGHGLGKSLLQMGMASVKAVVPVASGQKVLDLGCGYGWDCKYAQEQGASQVLGIDLSAKMIAEAQKRNAGSNNFLGCEVRKQHHTLTQILMGLLNCGFELKAVEEAQPSQEMLDIPGMQDELRRPMMLLVKAKGEKQMERR